MAHFKNNSRSVVNRSRQEELKNKEKELEILSYHVNDYIVYENNSVPMTRLGHAFINNDTATVKLLIKIDKIDVYKPVYDDGNNNNILHVAAIDGDLDLITDILNILYLYDKIVNTYLINSDGQTIYDILKYDMYTILDVDNLHKLKEYIEVYEDIEGYQSQTESINIALMKNDMENFQHELTDVNKIDDNGNTLLIHSTLFNNIDMMKYLIDKGADVNIMSKTYASNLHLAVINDNVESAQLLLDNGALTNINNENFETPLMIAEEIGNQNMITLLKQY